AAADSDAATETMSKTLSATSALAQPAPVVVAGALAPRRMYSAVTTSWPNTRWGCAHPRPSRALGRRRARIEGATSRTKHIDAGARWLDVVDVLGAQRSHVLELSRGAQSTGRDVQS